MSPQRIISPELRQWILDTTRAGHGPQDVLELMRAHGYDPRQSCAILAEVLKLPVAAVHANVPAPSGLRTKHPQGPLVKTGDREVRVTMGMDKPALRVLDGLLTGAECEELIELARPRLARALTVDAAGQQQVDHRRTSVGMFFKLAELPPVARLEQRIADLLDVPASHGEGLQILHYLPGQEYQPHYDWFDSAQPGYATITARGGQRIASVVMYLNTPEAGGGTAFPEVGVTVTALRGSAVYFAYEGGDSSSLHAGLPVQRGEKWIATKWLRERPY
ncbi:MAG: proline dioxygenase [Rhodanobacter sp. 68-29]|nr:2OG-Fe(II) oxygenase [Rhodanobacter sp.]ODU75436.1 MAG: proline dioxygenase [Rhodanobacter sp. SCN 69-32]OJY58661.1 MAG: proline dioxygenase [Rhodanobacter sp. 68-29]